MKPLYWVGSSKKDLQSLPEDVQDIFGYGLHLAQMGSKHSQAKPLKGFGGAGVLEVRITSVIPTERFTLLNLVMRCMCYMHSRKNLHQE